MANQYTIRCYDIIMQSCNSFKKGICCTYVCTENEEIELSTKLIKIRFDQGKSSYQLGHEYLQKTVWVIYPHKLAKLLISTPYACKSTSKVLPK